jgi:hypothetical protein
MDAVQRNGFGCYSLVRPQVVGGEVYFQILRDVTVNVFSKHSSAVNQWLVGRVGLTTPHHMPLVCSGTQCLGLGWILWPKVVPRERGNELSVYIKTEIPWQAEPPSVSEGRLFTLGLVMSHDSGFIKRSLRCRALERKRKERQPSKCH